MKRVPTMVTGLLLLAAAPAARAGEIGFLEDFALAKERGSVLEKLVGGTEESYYYRCLHLQETGRLEEVDKLLGSWIARYKRTARVREIENRQALLRYGEDPRRSLAFLRERLGLRFDHQRQVPGAELKLPSRLDEGLISREALVRRALQRHSGTLGGVIVQVEELRLQEGADGQRALEVILLEIHQRLDQCGQFLRVDIVRQDRCSTGLTLPSGEEPAKYLMDQTAPIFRLDILPELLRPIELQHPVAEKLERTRRVTLELVD